MSKMIERVAQALWALEENTDCHDWGSLSCEMKSETRNKARAAIAAMREPTQAMVYVANRNNHPRDIDTWRTMIDEALK